MTVNNEAVIFSLVVQRVVSTYGPYKYASTKIAAMKISRHPIVNRYAILGDRCDMTGNAVNKKQAVYIVCSLHIYKCILLLRDTLNYSFAQGEATAEDLTPHESFAAFAHALTRSYHSRTLNRFVYVTVAKAFFITSCFLGFLAL
jgi:hypothetical protein